jgi:SAM-dependent methyltransferase
MNPNQALWEKGDFTRLAATMRESGEKLVDALGVRPGMRVLDLGCGDGTTALPAAKRGADVLGVDIATNLVAAGNRRATEAGLANLRFQHGDGSRFYWDNPVPPNKDFVIEVTDLLRRFQPFQFTASIPAEGIFKWLDSPLSTQTTVPLFPAPTLSVASGMAVIRADLWDTSLDAPAAWAVIEAFTAGKFLGRGIADDAGRIAVIFAFPSPLSFGPGSPPGSPLGSPPIATSPPLTEQVWPLELRAFYTPDRPLVSPPDFIEELGPPLPDLRFTLSQPAATLWADADLTEILETNLRFGRELILKSRPSPSSPPSPLSQPRDSVLFISPAVSPP